MNEATTTVEDVKTFRGSSLEELLPQIRHRLGPDAVIVRQREGLVGGVGGFFQKKCIEVEARAGGPGIDVYDEEAGGETAWDEADGPQVLSEEGMPAGGAATPFSASPPLPPAAGSAAADGPGTGVDEELRGEMARDDLLPEAPVVRNDAATREGLATPAVQQLVGQAYPFAEMLADLGPEPEIEAPAKARALVAGMAKAGLGDDLARGIVEAVLASSMPFATPARLRTMIRNELALRLPVAPAAAPGPRALVFIGPAGVGKTAALEAIAAAHEAAGTEVTRLDASSPTSVRPLSPSGLQRTNARQQLTLVDTPALHGGARELGEVAEALAPLDGAEVHLVLRAGTAAPAAAEAIEGMAALAPTHLLMTGAGATAHLGGIADAAIRLELPLGYVAESATEIAPADPRALAGRLVP
jgi:flagellar biosynthesis protein FlhF